MSRSRPIILDPRRMFLLAEEFLRASRLLAQIHRQPDFPRDKWVPRPSIMLAAFSLELFFKCLYVLDHGKTVRQLRTHNLETLFKLLSPETQSKIREYFDPAEGQMLIDDFF